MGVFEKMLSGKAAVGHHPDSALSTTERGEAHNYIRRQYKCPYCSRQGSKEILGHATVGRKMRSSKCHIYDVYTVVCSCGKSSAFWSNSNKWNPSFLSIVDKLCKPNGKCQFIIGHEPLPPVDRSLFQ